MKIISFLDVKKIYPGKKSIDSMVIIEQYCHENNELFSFEKKAGKNVYHGSGFFWKMHEKSKNAYCVKGGNISEYFEIKYRALAKNFYNFFRFSNALKVTGLENLEGLEKSGCVVVANHKSALDPIYISSALKDFDKSIRWVSKKENFECSDLFMIFLEIGQVIPLSNDRKLTDYSRQKIFEVLEKKEALGIFPEGMRNKSGELLDFHSGASRICAENNVPYIPIGVSGKTKPFRGRVCVNVGSPVYLDDLCCDYESLKSASHIMRENVIRLVSKALK